MPVACLYLYMPLYVIYIIEYDILIKEMNWNGIETCFKAQIGDFKDCKLNYWIYNKKAYLGKISNIKGYAK